MKKFKFALKYIISIFVFIGILLLICDKIDIIQLKTSFSNVKIEFSILSILFFIGSIWSRIKRWKILLNFDSPVPEKFLWSSLLLGYFINVLIPARVGEIVRCYTLSLNSNIPTPYIFGTVVTEKILDISTLVFFLFIFIIGFQTNSPINEMLFRAIGILLLVVLLLIFLKQYFKKIFFLLNKIQNRISWLKKIPIESWMEYTLNGVISSKHTNQIIHVIVWTMASWIMSLGLIACILLSLNIKPWFPASLITMVVTNLGMIVPLTPGYIGVYHYLSIISLSIFQIDPNIALTFGIISHAIIFGGFLILGFITLVICRVDIIRIINNTNKD